MNCLEPSIRPLNLKSSGSRIDCGFGWDRGACSDYGWPMFLKGGNSMSARRYAIVIEHSPTSFGAYSPDVPEFIAAAETEEEVRRLIAEALEFHIEGLRERRLPIPEP
jgi:predicted RNase H-like HicB family nuclease